MPTPYRLATMGLTGLLGLTSLTACQHPPPAERPAVTATPYTQGNASLGQQAFEHDCAKCHRLQAGKNEKGPQLMRIYGSKSALLTDYSYSDSLKNSQIMWTADNLDKLMANPKQLVPNTKMKTDPMTDSQKRQNIIAYLSTLK